GIGARTLEQLADLARERGTSLYGAVPFMSGKGGSNLAKFAELVAGMAHEAQILSLPELIEHVVHHSGLRAHYQAEKEGAERLENLQELVNAATVFCVEENIEGLPAGLIIERSLAVSADPAGDDEQPATELAMSPLAAFLSHASLEAGDNQAQAGEDAVQLMTVH